ncbi:oligoendopeptidase F [Stakelama marina]|uniref:Oligopeptidase F n=1 Tax=Stakelama marina TaxID=2826939 RepID=A0A8T4IEA7_9SPHN|nr:oligoendopeptidase F [Stakelama marina]MBR0552900.1 oligoendopeptidase F [Stakelama marina]
MTDLNRREAIATTALASMAIAMPAWAQDKATPTDTAAWDLSDLYPGDAAWDAARKAALAELPSLKSYKGTLGDSASALARALTAQSDIGRKIARIYTYASLNADADVRVAANQEKRSQAIDLYTAYGEATAWMAPEILSVGKDKVDGFVARNPVLKKRFAFYLDNTLRQAPHTLSSDEEALLASANSPLGASQTTAGQLRAASIPWPTITLSTGKQVRLDDQGYSLNRDAPDRTDRKKVFDAFWGEYKQFESAFGSTYDGQLKADVFQMKARKYPTCVAAALSGANVPEAVYRTLVTETNEGLPQLHRYFALRQKLLGLPDMHYYDIYPPLVKLDRKITVPQMRETVLKAVAPLGPDYVKELANATAQKWMDPLPRPGKRSGAYMNPAAAYDVHPYLLLNLGENYEGMSTFAHEWGHAMHTLLANAAQPYDTADYPIFLAEIASTLNEQLLVAYMLERAETKEEKIFYLGQQMENIRGTYFRQAMFAEFELKAHDMAEAGEGTSGQSFTRIYGDLVHRYHGPKVAIDPTYTVEWAYIPHFYNSFYVYQYATSIAAASYFARAILKGGAKERDNYLSVLKAGGSDYPTEILKRAGLDMASPAPYRAIIQTFKETLDQAESLMA